MLSKEIIKRIEQEFGKKLRYNSDCDALSEAVFEKTGERLSRSTLERMFGLVGKQVVPRKSTLDILASYLGYSSYEMLVKDIGEYNDISDFMHVEEIVSSDLPEGSQIQFTYEPKRRFVLTYLGNNNYVVDEVYGSRNIQKGDRLTVSHIVKGYELIVSGIERNGLNLGAYTMARSGGVTSIEVLRAG